MLPHKSAGEGRGVRKGQKSDFREAGRHRAFLREGWKEDLRRFQAHAGRACFSSPPAPSQSLSGDAPPALPVLPGGPGRHVRGAPRREGRERAGKGQGRGRERAGKGPAPAPGSSALLGRAAAGTRPDWQEPAPSSSSLLFPPPRGGFQPSSSFLGEGVRV